jgi:hypothetical protein
MESEELVKLMAQVEEKGIDWSVVEEKLSIKRALLDLYAKSGPVPVTLIKKLEGVLKEQAQ